MTRSFWLVPSNTRQNRGFTYGLLIAFTLGAFCFMPFAILFNWQLAFAQDNFYGVDLANQVSSIQGTMQLITIELVLLTTLVAMVLGPLCMWVLRKTDLQQIAASKNAID